MKFKWLRSLIAIVLLFSLLSTLFLSLPAFAAVSDVTIQVTLLTPIEYTSKSEKATEEETADAILALKTITQVTYDAFIMDNPLESMWMNINGSKIEIQPEGSRLGNHYRWKATYFKNIIQARPEYENPAEMTRILQLVIDSFLPEGETTYDIVKSIHDYVCEQTKYDLNSDYPYSAYGALVDGRAVCEGYAEAFKLLCDKNGIPCILVSGKGITSSSVENHMWNYVRMEDGKWYAVDATWDDGNSISNSYLLVGSETIVNSQNGKLFSENHIADGDISDTGLKAFLYPDLALQSYLENNPPQTGDTNDTSDSESSSESDSFPTESETTESGTASFESTSDESESTDSMPSTADSTAADTGEAFSKRSFAATKEETGAFSPSYGYLNEDPEYFYYNQLNEEQQNFYNILKTISAPHPDNTDIMSTVSSVQTEDVSLQSVTTDTDKPITAPPTTTTETSPLTSPPTTERESTESFPPESSSETQTDPIDLTTVPDSEDSDTITDILTFELSEPTGDDTTTPDDPGFTVSISDIIRVIVIVLALLALFGLISLIVIRFSNNEKK